VDWLEEELDDVTEVSEDKTDAASKEVGDSAVIIARYEDFERSKIVCRTWLERVYVYKSNRIKLQENCHAAGHIILLAGEHMT